MQNHTQLKRNDNTVASIDLLLDQTQQILHDLTKASDDT